MKLLLTDELWAHVQSLLPPPLQRRFRFPSRKPLDYRQILTGILFVLKTGIAWDDLPAERSMAAAWGSSVGSSSEPFPGCIPSDVCGVVLIASPNFKRPSSDWGVRWSV